MNKKLNSVVRALALIVCCAAAVGADVRIRMTKRLNMPGMPAPVPHPQTGEVRGPAQLPESTVSVKGARMRTDIQTQTPSMAAGGLKKVSMTTIKQCDLGRQVTFTTEKKRYQVTSFGDTPSVSSKDATKKRGVVSASIAFTDTGERQQMFGLTARRVKSVMTLTPGSDATCTKTAFRRESDAWYVDLPGYSCPLESARPDSIGDGKTCTDDFQLQVTGKLETGFAVKETMTVTMDGQPPITFTSEAVELSQTASLDQSLFDVPPGYEADGDKSSPNGDGDQTQTRGLGLPPNAPRQPDAGVVETPASDVATVTNSAPALGPKQSGVIRVGVAPPEVQTPDSKKNPTAAHEMSAVVRDSVVSAFKKDGTIEIVALSSPQAALEARDKQCDYVLHINVTQKRGGGGLFGNPMAMSALSMASSMLIPGVGGMVAGAVANIAMSQTMGKAAKPKDEFTLDYKAVTPDDAATVVVQGKGEKVKVSKAGEDVLTPQIEKAAAAIIAQIGGKKTP